MVVGEWTTSVSGFIFFYMRHFSSPPSAGYFESFPPLFQKTPERSSFDQLLMHASSKHRNTSAPAVIETVVPPLAPF